MMVRTQISLDPAELQQAKARAAELGVSLAEFVRQAVRRELGSSRTTGHISDIFGIFGPDPGGPIAPEDYDDIIGRGLSDEYAEQVRASRLHNEQ